MESPTAPSLFTFTSCQTAILKKSHSERVPALQSRSTYKCIYRPTCSPTPLPSAAASDPSTSAPTRLQVPGPIVCQFPIRYHPDFESVKKDCDTWTLSRLLEPNSDAVLYQAYLDSLVPLAVAVAYPSSATRERHLLITQLTIWLFFLDDTVDAADTETAMELANAVMATLMSTYNSSAESSEYEYKTRSGPRLKRFVECFRVDLWEPMCQGMSPALQRRFAGEFLRSMKGMKEMWSLRQRGRSQANEGSVNGEEMLALRLRDAFCWSYLVLLEYSLAVDMPAGREAKSHEMRELMQKMKLSAATHLLWSNNMVSSGKEFALMDDTSIVGAPPLIAGDGGSAAASRASALEKLVGELWMNVQQQEGLFADLVSQIRSLARAEEGFPGHALSLMYAEAACSLLSGHLYWATRSGRYHGAHPVAWDTSPAYLSVPSSPLPTLNILL